MPKQIFFEELYELKAMFHLAPLAAHETLGQAQFMWKWLMQRVQKLRGVNYLIYLEREEHETKSLKMKDNK